jgi:D-sedoheptulose 7-phosphate isomerase
LVAHAALFTAFINDVAADMVFAQQVYGLGRPGDALLCISTSGNAANVLNAARVARAFGLHTLGLIGRDGGALRALCDVTICVPGADTAQIQEHHLPVYHTLCLMLEEVFFSDD